MTGQTLMLFDTASLYFRAFYALPSSMRSPDGQQVNAVRGLIDVIARLVNDHNPDALACAWDNDWRPQWRVDLVPSYKAHRVVDDQQEGTFEETPDALREQIPVIRESLSALGIPIIGHDGYEADDVLASLAHHHEGPCLVVTGDRDLFQLVNDRTNVIYTGAKGATPVVDDAWVAKKYGIPPSAYVDFAVLRGDPSDGLPGVPGVGDKTAAALITSFGTATAAVEAAMESSDQLRPRVAGALRDNADYIEAAMQVVRCATDLVVEEPADVGPEMVDEVLAGELSERWGIGSSMNRYLEALATR